MSDTLKWFKNEIRNLEAASQVHLSLYVPSELAGLGNSAASGPRELFQTTRVAHGIMPIYDLLEVQPGRLVLADVVRNVVVGLKRNDRAVVGVCGLTGMIRDATKAVRMCSRVRNRPLVDLHSGEFGW
jgi:hypothetical protein